MSHTDSFMQNEFLPFCQRVVEAFKRNHQVLYSTFSSFLSGENRIGIRLTENGTIGEDYTIVLSNVNFARIENGVLSPEVHTPFGVIKPYYIIEKRTVEEMIQDEQEFIAHPFSTKFRYLSEVTIRFLK